MPVERLVAVDAATVDVVHVGVAFSGRHGPPRVLHRRVHAEAVRTTRGGGEEAAHRHVSRCSAQANVRRRRRPVRRHGLSHRRTPGSPHVAADPAGVEFLGETGEWAAQPSAMVVTVVLHGSVRAEGAGCELVAAPRTGPPASGTHRPHRHSEQAGEQQDGGHEPHPTPSPSPCRPSASPVTTGPLTTSPEALTVHRRGESVDSVPPVPPWRGRPGRFASERSARRVRPERSARRFALERSALERVRPGEVARRFGERFAPEGSPGGPAPESPPPGEVRPGEVRPGVRPGRGPPRPRGSPGEVRPERFAWRGSPWRSALEVRPSPFPFSPFGVRCDVPQDQLHPDPTRSGSTHRRRTRTFDPSAS